MYHYKLKKYIKEIEFLRNLYYHEELNFFANHEEYLLKKYNRCTFSINELGTFIGQNIGPKEFLSSNIFQILLDTTPCIDDMITLQNVIKNNLPFPRNFIITNNLINDDYRLFFIIFDDNNKLLEFCSLLKILGKKYNYQIQCFDGNTNQEI